MPVDHNKVILKLEGVSFSYGKRVVLEKVYLEVHPGDYLGVIGPNGGGKTTLIKIMLGLLQAEKGSVELFGTPLSKFRDWSKIGYVSQKAVDFDTSFPLTVEEVVAMGRCSQRKMFQSLGEKDKSAITQALQQVEMTKYRKQLIGDLSGGQQQRVFIARALVSQPEIIFLDEPTSGIDQTTQNAFYELLHKINRELGVTLVFVSHDIEAVIREVTELAFVNQTVKYDRHPEHLLKEHAFLAPNHGGHLHV